MNTVRRGGLLLTLALIMIPVAASPADRDADAGTTASPKTKSFADLFEGMSFRCIGPYRGGRVTAVTGVRHQPLTFYMGATGGGVWRTTDGGSNWEVLSDKSFGRGSIGAIAVAESDPNVIYVGTGEEPIRGNVSAGDGVYKSSDGGQTWKNIGLRASGQIARIRVHPNDPDRVYVAVQGHVFGPNHERGIFRSEDGGRTWKNVLAVNDSTGASDLSMDPNNPRVLYAAFWQVVRRPWELVSGGRGSGLWRSLDGGETWKKLTEGLPEGRLGKIGVAASAARPGRVWAMVESSPRGGLYRSDDRGDKWTWVNDDHKIRERAWYYTWVYPDPRDAEKLYLPNVRLHRSTDGGRTFSNLSAPHGDHHDLWIDPDDSNRMILGNDGGATITFNGGRTWSTLGNQPTAQFYRVAVDDRFPYWVYGAQQDNSSVAIPSGVNGDGIDETDWHVIGGGESGWIAPSPRNPDIEFGGGYGGSLTRYDHRLHSWREVTAWPQLASGRPTSVLRYRWQWNAPTLLSMHDSTTVYHAAQVLLRSRDEGQTWTEISPDLTRNDRAKQGLSGGPITVDVTGVEVYDTIFALAESPLQAGLLWAGTDDGLVHVTRDDGKHWENVTPKGLPAWIQINAIDASPHDRGTAYLAATRYKFDDDQPYLYRTKDFGRSWTKIVTGLPANAFTRVVREDPARRGLLYAGTEQGLFVSLDDGAHWQPFQRNLPPVPITDLVIKNSDLVIATQGRSFWILDDLTPLRRWNDDVARTDAVLLPPRPAHRFQSQVSGDDEGPRRSGQNLPNGVIVNYWLREKPGKKDTVRVEIFAGDSLLRSFSSAKRDPERTLEEQAARAESEQDRDKPLEPHGGFNRFVWDMRVLKPTLVPKAVFNEGDKSPPKVGAGTYSVRLTSHGRTLTERFEVRPQPNADATAADLKAQYDLLAAIRDRLSESHTAVLTVRDVRQQVKALVEHAERAGHAGDLKDRAKALDEKLAAVESDLINPEIKADEDDLNYPPKLDHDFTALAGVVGSADARPTDGSVVYYHVLEKDLAAIRHRLDEVLSHDLAEFNAAVRARGIEPVVPAPKIDR